MRWRTGSVVYRDGAWWARVQYIEKGKRKEIRRKPKPFRLNTKRAAQDLRDQLIRDLDRGPTLRDPTLGECCSEFVALHCIPPEYANGQKIRGMSDWQDCKRFLEGVVIVSEIGARHMSDLTYAELRSFRDGRLATNKKSGAKRTLATTNREMAHLRRVVGYAVDAGYIARSPMRAGRGKALVMVSAESPRERILSRSEEAVMFFHYPSRSRDFFVFLLDTGMRRAEALAMRSNMVDHEAGVLRLPWQITKSKKGRVVPMSARVRAIVSARVPKSGTNVPIFGTLSTTIVRNEFRQARKAAGLPDLQMRDLRATFATRMIQAGMSEAEVAQMCGWRLDPRTELAKMLRRHYLRVDEVTMKKAADILNSFVG